MIRSVTSGLVHSPKMIRWSNGILVIRRLSVRLSRNGSNSVSQELKDPWMRRIERRVSVSQELKDPWMRRIERRVSVSQELKDPWMRRIERRWFSSSAGDEFTRHVALSKTLKDDPGNEAKLQLYALYKQATVGPNNTPKPGTMDIVGKYKWAAWSNLGQMTKEDAQKEYISTVQKLVQEIGTN